MGFHPPEPAPSPWCTPTPPGDVSATILDSKTRFSENTQILWMEWAVCVSYNVIKSIWQLRVGFPQKAFHPPPTMARPHRPREPLSTKSYTSKSFQNWYSSTFLNFFFWGGDRDVDFLGFFWVPLVFFWVAADQETKLYTKKPIYLDENWKINTWFFLCLLFRSRLLRSKEIIYS